MAKKLNYDQCQNWFDEKIRLSKNSLLKNSPFRLADKKKKKNKRSYFLANLIHTRVCTKSNRRSKRAFIHRREQTFHSIRTIYR